MTRRGENGGASRPYTAQRRRYSSVVDVSAYVSVPYYGTSNDGLRRYSSYPSAAYTLEVNAGEADRFGIRVGDKVAFENIKGHC